MHLKLTSILLTKAATDVEFASETSESKGSARVLPLGRSVKNCGEQISEGVRWMHAFLLLQVKCRPTRFLRATRSSAARIEIQGGGARGSVQETRGRCTVSHPRGEITFRRHALAYFSRRACRRAARGRTGPTRRRRGDAGRVGVVVAGQLGAPLNDPMIRAVWVFMKEG